MSIEKIFSFLVTDYGLNFAFQMFEKCFNGNWLVYTYSYYNESGCFTIHLIPERGEYDFYFSKLFCKDRDGLTEECLNRKIRMIEREAWEKAEKKILFEYRPKLMLKTLAKVIRLQIEQNGNFFNIQVKN